MNKINIPYVEIEGMKLAILETNEFHQIKYLNGEGFYEVKMLDFIRDNYSGGTFIDIGACLGNHSLFFSKIADKVYSFEPLLGNFLLFSLNLLINKISNVFPYNIALGDKNEMRDIYRGKGIVMGSASFTNPSYDATIKERVIIKKLDDFKIKDVTLIKIDVEEYNLPVLKGAIKTIKKYMPPIFIESKLKETYTQTKCFLESLGYEEHVRIFNATPTYLYTAKEGDKK